MSNANPISVDNCVLDGSHFTGAHKMGFAGAIVINFSIGSGIRDLAGSDDLGLGLKTIRNLEKVII